MQSKSFFLLLLSLSLCHAGTTTVVCSSRGSCNLTRSSSAGDHGFVPCGIDLVINWCKKSKSQANHIVFQLFFSFHHCLNDPQFTHAYYLCITRAIGPVKTTNDLLLILFRTLMYNFFVKLFPYLESCNICEISENSAVIYFLRSN